MNKSINFAKAFIIIASLIKLAHAASPQFSGRYAGVSGGLAFQDIHLKSQQLGFTDISETCNKKTNFTAFAPGLQFGYLYPLANHLVSGVEASAILNTQQSTQLGCNSDLNQNVYDSFTFKNLLQTSLKGRIGRTLTWTNQTVLPYIVAGGSLASVSLTYKNEGGDHYSNHTIQPGWLIGAGIEWFYSDHWSLRAEYNYINYGEDIHLKIPRVYGLDDVNGQANLGLKSSTIHLSANYWL